MLPSVQEMKPVRGVLHDKYILQIIRLHFSLTSTVQLGAFLDSTCAAKVGGVTVGDDLEKRKGRGWREK